MPDLQARLNQLIAEFDVPGVSVAVFHNGQVELACAGVTDIATAQPVTSDTIFAIGSITKVFTASLIMQLVESGALDLDRPVLHYLPELRLASDEQSAGVTVRHLLTHTSGIAGDHILDTGRGSAGVAGYVASLADLPVLHEPGTGFSYSNAAVILAGFLLERITGMTWPDLVRERLIEPLGLESMVVFARDADKRPIVLPHRRDVDGRPLRGDMWLEFDAGASAGFTPYATAADMVRFNQLHLDHGRSPEGNQLLSPQSVAAMQSVQVADLPSGAADNTGWGLGWALHQYGPERGLGHNGGTSAMLRVLPDRNFAMAVLTNISGGIRMGSALIWELIEQRFGIAPPALPEFEQNFIEGTLEKCVGTYEHLAKVLTIDLGMEGLLLFSGAGSSRSAESTELHAINSRQFMIETAERGWSRVGFVGARPDYFHMGLRAYKRLPEQ